MFLFLILQYSESQTTRTQHQQQNQMSATNTQTNFDGIHVSKGFVRGLQGQVLKLEQTQQSLIQQLEHANKLASEYHATAVAWKNKHDAELHEMEKTKQAFDHERMQWSSSLNQVVDMYEREKKLRLEREHEMTHLEQLLAEQIEMSPSPTHHPHRKREDSLPPHEPMSPVSVSPSSSPRTPMCDLPRMQNVTSTQLASNREYIQKQLLIEADTAIPFDENGERVVMRDGKKIKQSVCYGFGGMPWYDEKEMTTSEDEDSEDIDAIKYHEEEDDDIDWEQRERDDWTESIRSRARARVAA